jgi:hypothetical protein
MLPNTYTALNLSDTPNTLNISENDAKLLVLTLGKLWVLSYLFSFESFWLPDGLEAFQLNMQSIALTPLFPTENRLNFIPCMTRIRTLLISTQGHLHVEPFYRNHLAQKFYEVFQHIDMLGIFLLNPNGAPYDYYQWTLWSATNQWSNNSNNNEQAISAHQTTIQARCYRFSQQYQAYEQFFRNYINSEYGLYITEQKITNFAQRLLHSHNMADIQCIEAEIKNSYSWQQSTSIELKTLR